MEGELANPVEAMGRDSKGQARLDGSTRALITKHREGQLGKVLTQALSLHQDPTAWPVWVHPQQDRMCSAWLHGTTSPATFIDSKVFTEVMASKLCLPSPCCRGHVGKPTGYKDKKGNPTYVDIFGDSVMCSTLPFDTW